MEPMHPYPNFKKALIELAPTNEERARLLGCSVRSIAYYLSGEMLPPVEKVKIFITLDEALTIDIRSKIGPQMVQIPA